MKIINFSDKLAVEMICTDSDRLSSLNNFYDSNNVEKTARILQSNSQQQCISI